jgi:hypothetical protein
MAGIAWDWVTASTLDDEHPHGSSFAALGSSPRLHGESTYDQRAGGRPRAGCPDDAAVRRTELDVVVATEVVEADGDLVANGPFVAAFVLDQQASTSRRLGHPSHASPHLVTEPARSSFCVHGVEAISPDAADRPWDQEGLDDF